MQSTFQEKVTVTVFDNDDLYLDIKGKTAKHSQSDFWIKWQSNTNSESSNS